MKYTRFAILATCASPLLLASGLPREKVAFTPADGTSLTKTFTLQGKFEMDDMQMLMNGQENEMMPSMEMSMGMDQVVKVVDQYTKVGNGRPAQLSRRFEDINQDIEMDISVEMMGQTEDQNVSGTGESEFEGKTVVFTWDDGSEEFNKAYAEGSEGEVELLDGLTEDMDLRMLLPSEEVSEGDQWDIDPLLLVNIFAPGGDLQWDVQMDEEGMSMGPTDPQMMSNMRDMFSDSIKGTAVARYIGMRDVDDHKCAVVQLQIDVESANDLTQKFEEMMGEQLPEGIEVDIESIDMAFTFEGTGELLWDLRAGHVRGLSVQGDVSMAMDMSMSMNAGEELTMEMSMEMSGTISQKVEVE